jgi:hypothetical protein
MARVAVVVLREDVDYAVPPQVDVRRQRQQRVGAPLTLITCSGPFDDRTRRYRDNVLVTALRVS